MKIAAITKYKNGALWEALKALGWSQNELGRRTGMSQITISHYCTLKSRPSEPLALRIQAAFGKAGYFLDLEEAWPAHFKGLGKSVTYEQLADIEVAQLETQQDLFLNGSNEKLEIAAEKLPDIFAELTKERPHEARVLWDRFIEGKTLETVGREMGCTRERIRQQQEKALRVLRTKFDGVFGKEDRGILQTELIIPEQAKPQQNGYLKLEPVKCVGIEISGMVCDRRVCCKPATHKLTHRVFDYSTCLCKHHASSLVFTAPSSWRTAVIANTPVKPRKKYTRAIPVGEYNDEGSNI